MRKIRMQARGHLTKSSVNIIPQKIDAERLAWTCSESNNLLSSSLWVGCTLYKLSGQYGTVPSDEARLLYPLHVHQWGWWVGGGTRG